MTTAHQKINNRGFNESLLNSAQLSFARTGDFDFIRTMADALAMQAEADHPEIFGQSNMG